MESSSIILHSYPALFMGLPQAEHDLLQKALDFSVPLYEGKMLGTGESSLAHALGTSDILASLKLDGETRAAGVLFAVPEYLAESSDKLKLEFGVPIAQLVEGVWRLNQMRLVTRSFSNQESMQEASAQNEQLRKMLLAMVEDIRVVLIRLASRMQRLRYFVQHEENEKQYLTVEVAPSDLPVLPLSLGERVPEGRVRETGMAPPLPLFRAATTAMTVLAKETLNIYAPLANRLGVWQLKWQLEDWSFRYLDPENYKKISQLLDEGRVERENFIKEIQEKLTAELKAAGVDVEITGRPKHIYSIYNKMRSKHLSFSEVYDVRALRVLVKEIKDCYTVLGVVHNLWQPIPKQFDDYISRPKSNFYRSLHTAVIGPDGRALEIQIRTHEMHQHAELGVAAHWRYKEAKPAEARYDEKIAWLRQILAWRDEVTESSEWVEQFKQTTFDDTVYVLTPQNKVIALSHGATPVDFAYHLHTDLGHRCRGAKVDGVLVPLNYSLKNGQRVEIITAKQGGPSRDWLNAELGYLHSTRARAKVKQWFNNLELQETLAQGRAILEKELRREGKNAINLEDLAAKMGFTKSEDLFAALGRNEVSPHQVQVVLRDSHHDQKSNILQPRAIHSQSSNSGILIVGVDKLLTQLAKCCKPVPPDEIVGFITRGRGVSIHRNNCASLNYLSRRHPERIIRADWGTQKDQLFSVDIAIEAVDRQGLLRDISEVLARDKINVTATHTVSREQRAQMFFTLEVSDLMQLRHALTAIKEVSGVEKVGRR